MVFLFKYEPDLISNLALSELKDILWVDHFRSKNGHID